MLGNKELAEEEEAEAEEVVVSVKRFPLDFSDEIAEEVALVRSFVPLEIDESIGITRDKKDGSNNALDISGGVEDDELDDVDVEATVSSNSGTAERLEVDEVELDEEDATLIASMFEIGFNRLVEEELAAAVVAVVAAAPVAAVAAAAAVVVVVVVIVDGTSSIKIFGSLTTVLVVVEVEEDVLTVLGDTETVGTSGS